jgi:PAS domain S-box-containing protein
LIRSNCCPPFLTFLCFAVLALLATATGAAAASANFSALTATASPLDAEAKEKFASLAFGLFMGVMLTASLYLFFIWIVMRERGQVFLLFLLLSLGVNIASTNELLMVQLGLSGGSEMLQTYSMLFSYIFSIFFTYYFLDLEDNAPGFLKPFYILVGLLVVSLVALTFDSKLAHFVLPTIGALTIAAVLMAGIFCLREEISGSFTHIVAFLFFLIGCVTGPLDDLGFFSSAAGADNLRHIAFAMSAIMFAIVVATQFAARQDEKEKALAISNERFSLATKGAHEGLFDWDLKSGEVFFSEQFRKIIGVRLENKPAGLKSWMRRIVPADRRIVREALRRFRHNKSVNIINIEYRVSDPKDGRRWLHSKAFATRAPEGAIVRLVGSIGDITARKQSDVALRASEARFRSITEANPVPIMIVGLQSGTVLYASPGTEQLLGIPLDQLLHESFDRILRDEAARKELVKAMGEGRGINLKETILHRGDGNPLYIALSARPINYQEESAMALGLYDLTERKHAEAQIASQQEALQQSEKMAALGGLLAGVAHELNNPLSVALGQATLLMEGAPDTKISARAEKILKATDRCSRIVKSFLALARRKEPERKPVEINAIIQAALELLGFQLRTENIDIALELEPGLPEINGDADQLTQVITNLILNAAQAMQDWKGARRLTIRTWHSESARVFIRVADTGPGVPAEIRSRIFEPFFTTKGHKGGTGVGLSLCLNIVASHGGHLRLDDTSGGGATLTVELPMAQQTQPTDAVAAGTNVSLPPGLKVLLVDDEVELAQTLADLMESEVKTIDIAANGAIALEKLRKSSYDIIVSDLRMPVLDGPGLHEALTREMPAYTHKIIYVTGDTLSGHVQAFLNENPVPVVEKPYRLSEVRNAIVALLKENTGRRSMGQTESTTLPSSPA